MVDKTEDMIRNGMNDQGIKLGIIFEVNLTKY